VFLHGEALRKKIKAVMAEPDVCCAVAFWGRGAEDLLAHADKNNIRIICNLASGGTNPVVIAKLPRAKVRQLNTLHAKVYIGASHAIVTSANASANGLGLEDCEQDCWLEAGYVVDDIGPLKVWFEGLWKTESKEISPTDINDACIKWKSRRRMRPAVRIGNYDFSLADFPLVDYWTHGGGWKPNKRLAGFNAKLKEQMENGCDVRGPEDIKACRRGRWVLQWQREGRKCKGNMRFIRLGLVQEDAGHYRGENNIRVALAAEEQGQPPFDIHSKAFKMAFCDLINQPLYSRLRANPKGQWFTQQNVKLMQKFWIELAKSDAFGQHRTSQNGEPP
jgi:hypothetical protein